MLHWFRQGPSPHQTALAMIGAKAGDRVLFIGRVNGPLIGEVARITGLNGQTLVGCASADRATVEANASAAGALVDVVELSSFDATAVPKGVTEVDVVIALVDLGALGLDARLDLSREAVRVLRPGGRLILIDGEKRGMLARRGTPSMPADVVVPMLTSVGAIAARALGVDGSVTYYEARKSR